MSGWRSRTGLAVSSSEARCRTVDSANQLDTNCTPIGNPSLLVPNLNDDMHDGSVAQGDLWLSQELPKIMATDAYKNNGVIFITWDEGVSGDGPIGWLLQRTRDALALGLIGLAEALPFIAIALPAGRMPASASTPNILGLNVSLDGVLP